MDTLVTSLPLLLQGAATTLWLSVCSIVLATAIGVPLGVLSAVSTKPVRYAIAIYVYVIRGVPAVVTIFFLFFALPVWGLDAPRIATGVLALSLYGAAFFAEIVRGGIMTIPRGQTEAGRALGMMKFNLMRLVVLPQATRYAIPPYILMAARMIRTTSIVYIVGISDLTLVAREIVARDNTPFLTLGAAMLVYFALSYPLSVLGTRLEKRLSYVH
jgi:polar amino acid transport system permease protein